MQSIRRAMLGLCCTTLASAITVAIPLPARAQASSYPNRPIRFVVPFAAGGTTSILARALADRLGPAIGQPVVVDNRPGAGGNIGMEAVAKADPDGYTLLMGPIGLAINPALYSKLGFDPLKDLAPITLYGGVPNLLIVNPSLPVKSVKELIDYGRANPGKLSFASNGNGTSSHLAAEMLKAAGQIEMVHVPYKGGAPAMQDLIGGQVSMLFDQMPAVLPQVASGRVRALAVSSARRSSAAPDVPTVAESGIPGFDMTVWFGVLAPAGTPAPIIDTLNRHIVKLLGDAEFRKWLAAQGVDPMPGTPAQFASFMRSETDRWAKVVKQAGAKVD